MTINPILGIAPSLSAASFRRCLLTPRLTALTFFALRNVTIPALACLSWLQRGRAIYAVHIQAAVIEQLVRRRQDVHLPLVYLQKVVFAVRVMPGILARRLVMKSR